MFFKADIQSVFLVCKKNQSEDWFQTVDKVVLGLLS